mgnify:CR=1 FL=1
MTAIQIDANLVHDENGEIYISTSTVEYFHLKDGEKVIVYEGDEIWNAIIHSFISENKKLWYVELCEPFGILSEQQKEWNYVGYRNGFCKGEGIAKSWIIQQMISLGYSLDEIEKIVTMNEELKDKVMKLLQNND